MTPEAMATLHARAFAGTGRAWSAGEITDLLNSPHVFATCASHGFALTRAVADEAELLTIATDPMHRRQGVARGLLTRLETEAQARGAGRIFLEVAEDNAPATAFYASAGFQQIARRAGYYERPGQARCDALILEKPL